MSKFEDLFWRKPTEHNELTTRRDRCSMNFTGLHLSLLFEAESGLSSSQITSPTMTTPADPNDRGGINRIAVKAVPFDPKYTDSWFRIMEAQLFNLSRIKTEETKFFHVMSSLPLDVVSQLPPFFNSYFSKKYNLFFPVHWGHFDLLKCRNSKIYFEENLPSTTKSRFSGKLSRVMTQNSFVSEEWNITGHEPCSK